MTMDGGDGFAGKSSELEEALSENRRELAKALLQTVLRLALGGALIVGVMLLVPDTTGASSIVPFVVAILGSIIYVWVFRRQVHSVYSARYPTIRAVEALVLSAAMFLALFAMVYVVISDGDRSAFTEVLDAFSGYYYALTVLATVGFGDIAPVSVAARSASMVQMALDIAFIGVLIRIMNGVAKKAIGDRKARLDDPTGSSA
jgi:voltage-gated potassium channel